MPSNLTPEQLAERLRECVWFYEGVAPENRPIYGGLDTTRAAEMIREAMDPYVEAAAHMEVIAKAVNLRYAALREKGRALVEEFRKWEHDDTLTMIADEVQALAELLEEPCQKK